MVFAIVAVLASGRVGADRCAFGEHYTSLIRKNADGSFAIQTPDLEASSDGEIYTKPYTALTLRGMGYSPTPIGYGPASKPYGDYFTNYYKFLWQKDVDVMYAMGVNFVRVWAWDLFSIAEHMEFLDYLYQKGMYTMVPFQMGVGDGMGGATFTDLTDLPTREQAKVQFRFAAKSLLPHPAVLGFFIANEPEKSTYYAANLAPFFSLVNEFAEIMREVDAKLLDTPAGRKCATGATNVTCGHLMSVPLSAEFFRELLNVYYDATDIDFWSLQPYYANDALNAQYLDFSNFTVQPPTVNLGQKRKLRKLMLSERGSSSRRLNARNVTDDEAGQAKLLTDTWGLVQTHKGVGMVVMEFCDEWWKGMQSALQQRGCPDYDHGVQSDCGFVSEVTPTLTIVHEEHMGIYRQKNVKPALAALLREQELPLVAKAAVPALRALWCPLRFGNASCGARADLLEVVRVWNTIDRYPVLVLCLPIFLVLLFALLTTCCVRRAAKKEDEELCEVLASDAGTMRDGESAFGTYTEHGDGHGRRRVWQQAGLSRTEGLPQLAPHALAPVIDHIACMVARRLPKQPSSEIRDDIHAHVAAEAAAVCESLGLITSHAAAELCKARPKPMSTTQAASKESVLLPQYAEQDQPETPLHTRANRTGEPADLQLSTDSGTTDAHAATPAGLTPRKDPKEKENLTEPRQFDMHALETLGLKNAVEEACERYFSAIPSDKMFAFVMRERDSNSKLHAMVLFAVLRSIAGTIPHASLFFLRIFIYTLRSYRSGRGKDAMAEVMPWFLAIYQLSEEQAFSLEDLDALNAFDGGVDGDGAGRSMGRPEELTETFKRSFAERGSFIAPLVNFSFFVRLVLWVWFYAEAAQPVQLERRCAQQYMLDLSIADSLLMTFIFAGETYMLGGGTHTAFFVFSLIQFILHLLSFVALVMVRQLGMFALSLGGGIALGGFGRLQLELEVVYLAVSVVVIVLKMLAREWNMFGYGEHKLIDRTEMSRGGTSSLVRFFRMLILILSIVIVAVSLLFVSSFLGGADATRSDGFVTFYMPWLILAALLLIVHALAEIPNKRSMVMRRHLGRSQGLPAMFWTLTFVTFVIAMVEWVVPSVQNVTAGNVCADIAHPYKQFACDLGVASQWASAACISSVVFFFIFEAWKIIFGVIVGKMNGVGTAQNANDVSVLGPKAVLFPLTTVAAKGRSAAGLWAEFIRSMRREHLISKEEEQLALHFVDLRADDGTKKSGRSPRAGSTSSEQTATTNTTHNNTFGTLGGTLGNGKLKRMHSKFDEEGRIHFENDEARRRVTYFVSSLRAMHNEVHDEEWAGRDEIVATTNGRTGGAVGRDTLPHATVIVPLYNENVLFDPTEVADPSGPGLPPVIELLVSKYPQEWALFAEELREEGIFSYSPSRSTQRWESLSQYDKCEALLRAFSQALPQVLDENGTIKVRSAEPFDQADDVAQSMWPTLLVHRVCLWASFRGQTVARTLRGLENVRKGMQLVDDMPDCCRANDKLQVIIGAQEFAANTTSAAAQRRHLTHLQREWNFDIVYDLVVDLSQRADDCDVSTLVVQTVLDVDKRSHWVMDWEGSMAEDSAVHVTVVPQFCLPAQAKAYFSCHRRYDPRTHAFVTSCIQRPGPLRMSSKFQTQGKAENQFHCVTFARGEVTFALDMNQDFGMEEGYKMPMFLRRYFDKPQHAIVGFVEHCMTRDVSLVGEMQGAAEFAFVTIVNRTLARILRMRLHYGHPDAFDGVRIRIAGGMSKASHNVNLSEDVFSGFEAVARNSRVAYCEWLQAQKARDVFYEGTQTFNAKIHQGCAQQMRSRDVYFLFQRLPTIPRLSLLGSAFGFYICSAAFGLSIFLYTWSILLFAVSDVRFHKIGVFGGKLATAWVFQLGYFLILPLFVENTIRYGIVSGVKSFFQTVIPSLFFHSSALLTGSYHLLTALRTNQGIYLPTGRGFGLPQMSAVHLITTYGLSHFWPATQYTVLLLWFRAASPEDGVSYILRTFAVWFMVLSSFLSMHVFRVVPSPALMLQEAASLGRWLWGPPVRFSHASNPASWIAAEQRRPTSYWAWRTAVAMDHFNREDESTAGPVVVLMHLLDIALTELPVMALLLSYFQEELLSCVLMIILVVITAVVLRVALYRVKTAHIISAFELLLMAVLVVVLVVYFLMFDIPTWGAIVTMIMTVYVLMRLFPSLAAAFIRAYYLAKSGRIDEEQMVEYRESAATCVAFADASVAALASVLFFVLAFVASHLHTVFTALMYSGSFVMRQAAYASRRKVTVRTSLKDE